MCKGSILPCIKKFLRQGIILSVVIYMLGITKAQAYICFLPNGEDCQNGLAINSTICKKWSDTERQKFCSSKNGYVSKSNVASKEASGFNCESALRTLGDVCCPGWYYCTQENCQDRGFKDTHKKTPADAYICTECTQGGTTYYKCEARPCNYNEENPGFSSLEDKCDGSNDKYCLAKYAECQEGYEWVADSNLRAGKQKCGKCREAEIPQIRCAGVTKWKNELPNGCVTCTPAGDVNGKEYYCCQDIEGYTIPESLRDLTDGACHQYDGPVLSSGSSPIYCYKRVEKDCGNDNQYLTSGINGCYCRDYAYEFDAEPEVLNFDAAGKPIGTGDTVTVTSTRAHQDGSHKEFNKYSILENSVEADTGCKLLDDAEGTIKVSCRRNEKIGEELSSEFVVRHLHTTTKLHPELSKKIIINVEGDKCLDGLAIEPEIECLNGTKGKKTETNSVSGAHPCYKCVADTCPDDTWIKCEEDGKDCSPNSDGYEVQKTEYGNYCIRVKPCESGTIPSNQRTSGEKCYEEAGHSGEDTCWKHKDPLSVCSADKGEVWDEKTCSCIGSFTPGSKSACFDEVWGEEKAGTLENGKIVGGNVYISPNGEKTYKEVPENPCIEQGTKVYKAEHARNNYVFDFGRCVCQAPKCPEDKGYYDNTPIGCFECEKETVNSRKCLKCKTFDEVYGGYWVDDQTNGVCWDKKTEKVAADKLTHCLKTKECECPNTHPNKEKPKCFDEVMGMVDQNEYHIGGLTCYKNVTECAPGEKRDETTCKCKPSPDICPEGTFTSEEECVKGEGCFDCVKRTGKDSAQYGGLTCYERVEMLNYRTEEEWASSNYCYSKETKTISANKKVCYEIEECKCPENTSIHKPECYDYYAAENKLTVDRSRADGVECYPTIGPKCDTDAGETYNYEQCKCTSSACLEGEPISGIPLNLCRECKSTGQIVGDKTCWVCGAPEPGYEIALSNTECKVSKEFKQIGTDGNPLGSVTCFKPGAKAVTDAECKIRVITDEINDSVASIAYEKYLHVIEKCEAEGSESTAGDILIGTGSIAVSKLDPCKDGKISFTDKGEYKNKNYICSVDEKYAPDCPQPCTEKCSENTYFEDDIPNKDALGAAWTNSWVDSGEKACGKICYKAKEDGCPDCVPEDQISGCKQCTFAMYSGTTAMYKCTDLNPADPKHYTDNFKEKSTLTIHFNGEGWTCKQVGIIDANGLSKSNSECCAPKVCEREDAFVGRADVDYNSNPDGCKEYIDAEEKCHYCAVPGGMSGNYSCYTENVSTKNACYTYGDDAHPYKDEAAAKKGMACKNVELVGKMPGIACYDTAYCYKCNDPGTLDDKCKSYNKKYTAECESGCQTDGKTLRTCVDVSAQTGGLKCFEIDDKTCGNNEKCNGYTNECEANPCPDCVTENEISGCKQCKFFGYSGSTAMYKCTDLNPVNSNEYTDNFKDKSTLTINKGSDGWTCKPVGIIDSNGSSKGGSECCAPNACTNPDYPYAGRADNGANRNPDGCKEYIDAEEKCHYCVTGTGGMSGNYVCYAKHTTDNPVCSHYGADAHPYKDAAAAKKGMGCKNVELAGSLAICDKLASCYKCTDPGWNQDVLCKKYNKNYVASCKEGCLDDAKTWRSCVDVSAKTGGLKCYEVETKTCTGGCENDQCVEININNKETCPIGYVEITDVAYDLSHLSTQDCEDPDYIRCGYELEYNGSANGHPCGKAVEKECPANSCTEDKHPDTSREIVGYSGEKACYDDPQVCNEEGSSNNSQIFDEEDVCRCECPGGYWWDVNGNSGIYAGSTGYNPNGDAGNWSNINCAGGGSGQCDCPTIGRW